MALSDSAQRSLASQAGRPIAETDEEKKDPIPLSTEAENLPSFELLAGMTLPDCLAVINNKLEKARESGGVGSDVEAFQRATTPVVYSGVQIDNRLDQLHSVTFLRAPLSEPEVWRHLLPKKLPQITTFLPEGAVGFDCGISDIAIKKMSDRKCPLELKHILKSNAHVEKSAPISKRRAVEGVGLGDTFYLFSAQDAEFPWEVLECMLTASSINQQLWPIDNCFHNIIRVLSRFHLFYDQEINTKFQVKLCREYIDAAFLSNSWKAKNQLPCLTMKQCEDIAVDTLRRNKRSGVVSPFKELAASTGPLKPGQNSAQFNLFALSNMGKAQKSQIQRRIAEGYGGYGRGGGGQQVLTHAGAAGGSWMPPGPPPLLPAAGSGGRGKAGASGSGSKSALQICPAFSKGIPCVRGGDKASCTIATGVVLHHICGICVSANHGTNGHN